MSNDWKGGSTRRWRKLRAWVLLRDGHRCQIPDHPETPGKLREQLRKTCTQIATHVHHLDGVEAGLICAPNRLTSSCESCNLAIGDPKKFTTSGGRTPVFPVSSLSPDTGHEPVTARPELIWNPTALAAYDWLLPYLEVPADASPPLWMTPPHPEAIGSYGAHAIWWVETTQSIQLRWWQRLAIVRQLEHREDGTLCWRTVVESCPRRAGKSVRIRGMALWRMAHAAQIGEVQTIVHCGNDLPICREIQRGAWRWSEAQGWTVGRSNGKEAIEAPDGSRWLVRSQDGVYGWDAGLAVVDEAWDVKPDTVSEGLEPAMLERLWAQLHLTSTSHRRATSLMKQRIIDALTVDDGETLLMLWGAPADADPRDPAVWKAASPHWSEDRRRMIANKLQKALAGEADPEADDPDPLAGWQSQYLNIWRLREPARQRGDAAVAAEDWAELAAPVPDREPDSAAVESWYADGVSLALAWQVEDGVVVSVSDHPDLPGAVAALKGSGFRRPATVGASLLEDPAMKGVRAQKGQGRASAAVQELARLLSEDAFQHDGGEHLTKQALSARTLPGADGPRMASNGRADAIKAAVWAVTEARRPQRSPLVVL